MKTKIKVREIAPGCIPLIIEKGEWIDLRAPMDYSLKKWQYKVLGLGVAMELPEGYEAIVAPRSSTFRNYGVMLVNSIGIIDHSYCGNNDEWKAPVIAMRDAEINAGDRICQFRIQLSQKATLWQRIKWLLSSGVELEQVNWLYGDIRVGIGSTGRR